MLSWIKSVLQLLAKKFSAQPEPRLIPYEITIEPTATLSIIWTYCISCGPDQIRPLIEEFKTRLGDHGIKVDIDIRTGTYYTFTQYFGSPLTPLPLLIFTCEKPVDWACSCWFPDPLIQPQYVNPTDYLELLYAGEYLQLSEKLFKAAYPLIEQQGRYLPFKKTIQVLAPFEVTPVHCHESSQGTEPTPA